MEHEMTEQYTMEINALTQKKRYRQINRVLIWQADASPWGDGRFLADCCYNGFGPADRNVIKSVAKSIMSVCVGIALDQGIFKSLDEPVYRFIPEFAEGRDPRHRQITLAHLLTMTSGIYWNGGIHYHCPMMTQMRRSGDWISHIADCAVTDAPGARYNYKEWDILLLARLLDHACGDLYDFITDHLYKPLDIVCGEEYRWYKSPCGVYYSVAEGDQGAEEHRSSLSAYDLLKIGRLFLQDGIYQDRQIVSASYCRQAAAPSRRNPGYGFLWWVGQDWYGCRGFGGQSVTVLPGKNAIIITQATPTARGMAYDDVIQTCANLL